MQPAVLLSPDFDLEILAESEAYTRLAPRIERPRGKGDRHDSDKEGTHLVSLQQAWNLMCKRMMEGLLASGS